MILQQYGHLLSEDDFDTSCLLELDSIWALGNLPTLECLNPQDQRKKTSLYEITRTLKTHLLTWSNGNCWQEETSKHPWLYLVKSEGFAYYDPEIPLLGIYPGKSIGTVAVKYIQECLQLHNSIHQKLNRI